MKITKLEVENFKRLRAVTIEPDGSLVRITGRNGQGKSSTLDAIEAALGGAKSAPDRPIRDGEESSRIVLEADDMVVRRVFDAKGSRLKVEWHGVRASNPQSILDGLTGRICFDPIEFMRQPPKDQAATLRDMVGIDTSALDAERRETYDRRRDLNVELRAVEARHKAIEIPDGTPDDAVDVGDLMERIDAANAMAQERTAARDASAHADVAVENLRKEIERKEEEIVELQAMLAEEVATAEQLRNDFETMPEPEALEPLKDRLESATTINQAVTLKRQKAEAAAEIEQLRGRSEAATKEIERIDSEKRRMAEEATYPIEGLTVTDDGVAFGGVPLSQASSAEQLRVSAAIGMALNPELRVLLIREGSLLDKDSLAMLAKFADENDAQVWLEAVADDPDGAGVFIEDGEIVERGQ